MKNMWLEENKNKMRDYILMMLGAPVITVELDDAQIDLSIAQAKKYVDCYLAESEEYDGIREDLIQEGALIYAKMILGRIRCKFQNVENRPGMDGESLIEETRNELPAWRERVLSYVYDEAEDEIFLAALTGLLASGSDHKNAVHDARKIASQVREEE